MLARKAAVSAYAGHTSSVSPLTRNVPRASTVSLRVYWIDTSLRSSRSRSIVSPRLSICMFISYTSGDPSP